MDFGQPTQAKNPNQIYAHLDLTGISWVQRAPQVEFALVSRQHILAASHYINFISDNDIRFMNSSGQIVNRKAVTYTTIKDIIPGRGMRPDDEMDSDLTLITLSAPIDESEGVTPVPYLNLANDAAYVGLTMGVTGMDPPSATTNYSVIGQNSVDLILTQSLELNFPDQARRTRYLQFDYSNLLGDPDDAHFEVGDSGSPSFVEVSGRAAVVGVHSIRLEINDGMGLLTGYENYDTFVPFYADQLDAAMAPLGYRMQPVNAASTTLTGISNVVETTPRQAKPLTFEFEIENSGSELTGNVEVEFEFLPGEEPTSVSAPGWITYGAAPKWTFRRATMDPATSFTLSASWSAAPIAPSMAPTVTWRSDTVAEQSISPVIALAPSFVAWADGLAAPGEEDDPDSDYLVNLYEYGVGGDPESGILTFGLGESFLPVISEAAGLITLTHPERTDKALRGLSYILEYSPDLNSWSDAPPPGVSSSAMPYAPDFAGFTKRTVTWPIAETHRFVRLRIELNE